MFIGVPAAPSRFSLEDYMDNAKTDLSKAALCAGTCAAFTGTIFVALAVPFGGLVGVLAIADRLMHYGRRAPK